MSSTSYEEVKELVKPVGEAIDNAFEAEPICCRSREQALYHLLAAFEEGVVAPTIATILSSDVSGIANSDNLRRTLEMAITEAVRAAFRLCEPVQGYNPHNVPNRDTLRREARHALDVAHDYHVVKTALEDVMNNRRTMRVKRKRVRITFPGGIDHVARINVAEHLDLGKRESPLIAGSHLMKTARENGYYVRWQTQLHGLAREAAQLGCSADECAKAVADLIYDPAAGKRNDIFFQPLLPFAEGRVLLSPLIVTLSRWERNLERLWAMKYGSQYSKAIGSKKGRLGSQLADRFKDLG